MATLSLYGDKEKFEWGIYGFQSDFTRENGYLSAGITDEPFDDGAESLPGRVIASKSAGTTGYDYVEGTRSYFAGTYTFYGFAK